MIKSMTAYSRMSLDSPLGRLVIEIHSVNRKMLDMSLYLPKDLLRFDIEIRKWLSQSLERGQITLRLNLQSDGLNGRLFATYAQQLKGLKEGWQKLAQDLGYEAKSIDLPFLMAQMQIPSNVEIPEEEELKSTLKTGIEKALQELLKMKEKEGGLLAFDIQNRLKTIEKMIAAIELKKDEPLARYHKKLIDRLKEIGQFGGEAEERMIREVALLAEKMDVTEELVRLGSHIEQFRGHLASQDKAVGRTLEFLTQEMNREINTLGSKSMDSEISTYVVKIKGELDKIREQIQNIE